MNDSYKELLVSKEQGVKDKLIRVVSIIPTVLAGLLALLTGNILIFIIAVAFGVLDYFVFQWSFHFLFIIIAQKQGTFIPCFHYFHNYLITYEQQE